MVAFFPITPTCCNIVGGRLWRWLGGAGVTGPDWTDGRHCTPGGQSESCEVPPLSGQGNSLEQSDPPWYHWWWGILLQGLLSAWVSPSDWRQGTQELISSGESDNSLWRFTGKSLGVFPKLCTLLKISIRGNVVLRQWGIKMTSLLAKHWCG